MKFGTGILTQPATAALDVGQFARLTQAIADVKAAGHEVIVVTSGAVGAGLRAFGMDSRPQDTATLQACAAVGQTRLMHLYEMLLGVHGLHVAQLLVTHEDFEHPDRRGNFHNTLSRLIREPHIIPVINENDSVAIVELRFGDNDALSAGLSKLIQADLLLLFTSVDGLMPPGAAEGEIVEEVRDIESVLGFARDEKGQLSVGGMASKLRAVEAAVNAGIETVIANGRKPEQIPALVRGSGRCTRFFPRPPAP